MSYGRRGPPPNTDGMVSLKVDNLTFRTREDTLKRVFEKYGDVGDVYIPRDPFSQESRGFAFVRFYDERDADDAIEAIDGTVLDGREIRVKLAKHPRPVQSYYRGSAGTSSRGRPRRRSYSRSRSRSKSRSRSRHRKRSSSRSRSRSRSGRNKSEEDKGRSEKNRDGRSKRRERTRSPEQNNGDERHSKSGRRSRSHSRE